MTHYLRPILFGLLSFLLAACVKEELPENIGIKPGDALPAFSISLNDGRTISDVSLRGKVGVIEFFNTGCQDCRRSLPVFQEVYDYFKTSDNVEVFCISREEDEKEIEKYWNANDLSIPFSAQTGREVYSLFASIGIPRIYISDKEGIIRYAYDDSNTPSTSELIEKVKGLEN